MGHNNDWTMLYKGTGISIGEIKTVLDFDSDDLGTLCGGKYPTANAYPDINIFAKYKPFRSNDIGITSPSVWLTAMQEAGFGFGDTKETLKYGWNQSSPEWGLKYLRPRGRSYGELFRQLDFVDLTASSQYGYDSNAVPPIAIEFTQALYQSNSGVTIKLNGNASNDWNANTCVSFGDIFPSSLSDYKFCVLLIYQPSHGGAGYGISNLIISNHGPGDVSGNTNVYIPFAGVESSDHIYVPLMDGTLREGDTVTVKVGLVKTYAGWGPAPGEENQWGYIYAFNADPQADPHQYSGYLVSLNVQGGIDSTVLTYLDDDNSIYGLRGSISATVSSSASGYAIDNVTINLDKTGCISWGDRTRVEAQLFICAQPTTSAATPLLFFSTNSWGANSIDLAGISYAQVDFPVEQEEYGVYSMARLLNSDSTGNNAKIVAVTGTAAATTWATTVLNKTGASSATTLYRAYLDKNSESGISSGHNIVICGYVYSGSFNETNPETSQGTIIMLEPATIYLN